jgi:group I intron endonuclease
VYLIRELINGKIYIGSSGKIYKRISRHKQDLNLKFHPNSNFNKLLKETNIKNFELIVIFTDTREEAYDLEQLFVDKYKDTNLLLNTAHDVRFARLGAKNSEEHIQRMREFMSGRKASEQTRKLQSDFHKTNTRAIEQHKEIIEAKRRKISVYGTVYESITEAGNLSPYSHSFIRRRVRKNDDPNIYYLTDNVSPLLGRAISEEKKKALSEFRKNNLDAIEQFKLAREANKKKILLDGVLYSSVLEAVKQTGISEHAIHKQLKRTGGKDCGDVYILNYVPFKTSQYLIDGIIYDSMADAITKTGLSKSLIKCRTKAGKYKRIAPSRN